MAEQIIVLGGGGHAKVVIDCIRAAGDEVAGILDDSIPKGTLVADVPILGKTEEYKIYSDKWFLIAIGNNAVRRAFAENMCVRWHTVIHPRAVVSAYAEIAEGTVVMPNAVINAGSAIGKHCIINTGAIIEHDNIIEDFVHISPAAALGGTVFIGSLTHVGIGAAVKNNIKICGGCTIGAGAVVVKNITERGTYIGVPARKR